MNRWFLFTTADEFLICHAARDWSVSLRSVFRYGSTKERKYWFEYEENLLHRTSFGYGSISEMWKKKVTEVKHAFEYLAPEGFSTWAKSIYILALICTSLFLSVHGVKSAKLLNHFILLPCVSASFSKPPFATKCDPSTCNSSLLPTVRLPVLTSANCSSPSPHFCQLFVSQSSLLLTVRLPVLTSANCSSSSPHFCQLFVSQSSLLPTVRLPVLTSANYSSPSPNIHLTRIRTP